MPDAIDAAHFLALMTRARGQRTRVDPATGELVPIRLYDVRAFKSAFAELGYVRRLKGDGMKVTSTVQLVKGLAYLHPAWRMDGDAFADRDRHQQDMRRRLTHLEEMGLLIYRPGLDVDGEVARSEIELRPAPTVSAVELAAARGQLAKWKRRYGARLNTGSTTGIVDALDHGRPLSVAERKRRGITRARARAGARRASAASETNCTHHAVAPRFSENSLLEIPANLEATRNACGLNSRVTRFDAPQNPRIAAALESSLRTASSRVGEPAAPGGLPGIDEAALLERVRVRREALRAHQEARRVVVDVIAGQATQRAADVAAWPLDRAWPAGRLREAWVVWHHGATRAAESGPALAGPLEAGDLERLRRAAARYLRHAEARPAGFPAGLPLGGLAHFAGLAAERYGRSLTLRAAIMAFDKVTKRMRAIATARDDDRLARLARRAAARHPSEAPPGSWPRLGPWPRWVALDEDGDPVLVDGQLQIAAGVREWAAPKRDSDTYLEALRDAHLLAGLWPPIAVDGRFAMSRRNYLGVDRPVRAEVGPYPAPADRPERPNPVAVEYARRAGISLRDAQRLNPDMLNDALRQLRAQQEQRDAARRVELWEAVYLADRARHDPEA